MDKKNVQNEKIKNILPKTCSGDHNEKLASQGRQNFFHFVTINFSIFLRLKKLPFFSFPIMEIFGNDLGAKGGKKGQKMFECETCDFKCSKKYSWERHVATRKHTEEINGNDWKGQKGQKGHFYQCDACAKEFRTNAGLWKHKKICQENATLSTKDLVISLLKQNNELQQSLLEVIKSPPTNAITTTNNNNNNNNTNTNTNMNHSNNNSNNSFNLQFFLNETCKHAMNMSDFLDSIQLQLSDLINVGERGFVEGISSIIIKKLNDLDVTERPVHCTDKKRETFYVKDENKWEKDNEANDRIRKMVKKVAYKNEKLFPQFKEKFPDYNQSESKYSDQYSKIVIESFGGSSEKEDKIIRNISKVTTV